MEAMHHFEVENNWMTLFETNSIPTENEMTNLWRAVAPEILAYKFIACQKDAT